MDGWPAILFFKGQKLSTQLIFLFLNIYCLYLKNARYQGILSGWMHLAVCQKSHTFSCTLSGCRLQNHHTNTFYILVNVPFLSYFCNKTNFSNSIPCQSSYQCNVRLFWQKHRAKVEPDAFTVFLYYHGKTRFSYNIFPENLGDGARFLFFHLKNQPLASIFWN